jgi:hypothetical protein
LKYFSSFPPHFLIDYSSLSQDDFDVRIGGKVCDIQGDPDLQIATWSSSWATISCTVPDLTAGFYNVSVLVQNGGWGAAIFADAITHAYGGEMKHHLIYICDFIDFFVGFMFIR